MLPSSTPPPSPPRSPSPVPPHSPSPADPDGASAPPFEPTVAAAASGAPFEAILAGSAVPIGPALGRLILRTDGTLTELIDGLVGERLVLTRVPGAVGNRSAGAALLDLADGEPVLERRITLDGSLGGDRFVYAETVIAARRLPAALHDALVESDEPLGRLCRQHRLELFREPPLIGLARMPSLDGAGVSRTAPTVVGRRYRMIRGGRPLAVIDELFLPALWSRASLGPRRPGEDAIG